MRNLPLWFLLLGLMVAVPARAQSSASVPPRPALAGADTNDARAYYEHGVAVLSQRPREAADAFYWAYQLDPTSADALYGRYAALLLSEPRRLLSYWQGDRRTVRSPEVQAIDSLYLRALSLDPFLRQRFDRDVFRSVLTTWARSQVAREQGGLSVSEDEILRWTDRFLLHAGPLARAREASGEGRLMVALEHYDNALKRERRRKSPIYTERGRLFAHVGNDPSALADLTRAVEEMRTEDEKDLVFVYESKALLEHSIGALHERMGAVAEAREAYSRALQEDLAFAPAHRRLAVLALAEGDTAAALGTLGLAVQANGQDPLLLYLFGSMLVTARRLDDAADHLTRASELVPHFAEPYFVLGVVQEMRGQAADAVAAYHAFLDRASRGNPRVAPVQQRVTHLETLLQNAQATGGGR